MFLLHLINIDCSCLVASLVAYLVACMLTCLLGTVPSWLTGRDFHDDASPLTASDDLVSLRFNLISEIQKLVKKYMT